MLTPAASTLFLAELMIFDPVPMPNALVATPQADLSFLWGIAGSVPSTAADWGWLVDPTAARDRVFTMPGKQIEMSWNDLQTVLNRESTHILAYDRTNDGLMSLTLADGIGETPTALDLFVAEF
jgi:hypothetical protein